MYSDLLRLNRFFVCLLQKTPKLSCFLFSKLRHSVLFLHRLRVSDVGKVDPLGIFHPESVGTAVAVFGVEKLFLNFQMNGLMIHSFMKQNLAIIEA